MTRPSPAHITPFYLGSFTRHEDSVRPTDNEPTVPAEALGAVGKLDSQTLPPGFQIRVCRAFEGFAFAEQMVVDQHFAVVGSKQNQGVFQQAADRIEQPADLRVEFVSE